MPLIVETVRGATMADLRQGQLAATDADIVELRLDGVTGVDLEAAIAHRSRPVIVTCRPVWEGGDFTGDERDRLALLRQALELGADYVDVEWRSDWQSVAAAAPAGRIVLSTHDFEGTPADLLKQVREMRRAHDGVLKFAVTAKRLTDCVTLRDAVAGDRACVAIAMGQSGLATRLWPAGFGSCWTFAGSAASGQRPVGDLTRTFRSRDTTSATAVYGVAGAPIAHSASPAMHNAAFAALGIDAVYLPLETADAGDLLSFADATSAAGLSITAPLKSRLAERVACGPQAERLGAVNTLRRAGPAWAAENFDVDGFLAPVEHHSARLRGARAIVLGAGGAAAAAASGLHSRGARVWISARRDPEADRLARRLGVGVAPWPPSADWDVVVNATPVGTWPDEDQAPVDWAPRAGSLVYDLVYNPAETTLMARARRAGAEVIGGLDMLVGQAAQQCAWWTGRVPPVEKMREAAEAFLARGPIGATT